MQNKEGEVMRKEKVKRFLKEHAGQIAMCALAITAFGLGIYVSGRHKKNLVNIPAKGATDNVPPLPGINYGDIDEDIFTRLAFWIEDNVLDETNDEAVLETFYNVPFPKNGDIANGTYDVRKYVKILVQDATETN